MMLRIATLLLVALGSCSDSPVATPDQRIVDRALAEAASADRGPASEARPGDGKPVADQPAADQKPASDAKPGGLHVTIVSAEVWANLMPPSPPDPIGAQLKLSLTNSGGQAVTGITLEGAVIQPVPSGSALPITLQAQAPFTGTVAAGQTVTAEFLRVKTNGKVPLPTTCDGLLKLGFTVKHAGGSVGPLWSSDLKLLCAY